MSSFPSLNHHPNHQCREEIDPSKNVLCRLRVENNHLSPDVHIGVVNVGISTNPAIPGSATDRQVPDEGSHLPARHPGSIRRTELDRSRAGSLVSGAAGIVALIAAIIATDGVFVGVADVVVERRPAGGLALNPPRGGKRRDGVAILSADSLGSRERDPAIKLLRDGETVLVQGEGRKVGRNRNVVVGKVDALEVLRRRHLGEGHCELEEAQGNEDGLQDDGRAHFEALGWIGGG